MYFFILQHEPSRIIDIEFGQRKRQQNDAIHNRANKKISKPSDSEQLSFLSTLQKLAPEAAILDACVSSPGSRSETRIRSLPPTITSLYKPHYKNLSSNDLAIECQRVFDEDLTMTPSESHYLFKSTMLQSHSSIWYQHRKGRLTASQFGDICKTSLKSPSQSLIQSILERKSTPKIPAVKWGIDHESEAREAYVKKMQESHQDFKVEMAGLYVNPLSPHLGASCDGLVSCLCCTSSGLGVLEIKCPFSVRHSVPTNAACFVVGEGGVQLSRKHDYYYQIQGQMAVLERDYCDFVCWTPLAVQIERVYYDDDFISTMIPKLDSFFLKAVLPRILCGSVSEEPACDEVYCFCRKGEFGRMISCDSPDCKFVWFHYPCLNLDPEFEAEEWYCPDCEDKRSHLP